MQAYLHTTIFCLILSILMISACSTEPQKRPHKQNEPQFEQQHSRIELSPSAKRKIGNKIWQNESNGSLSGLTHWNDGEEFPSMGIGHFIWYPEHFNGRWTESFPLFVAYAQQRGVTSMPTWITTSKHCPWPDKTSFMRDFNGSRLSSLRSWLANNVSLQTDYIIQTSRQALPKIMDAAPAQYRDRIHANYRKVSASANGIYALIDYVNFKGDGTNPTERYKEQGWGLMWVLMDMRDVPAGQAAAAEFSAAAKRCLDRRIQNSPPSRGEKRWRAGWHNRCNTYAKAL